MKRKRNKRQRIQSEKLPKKESKNLFITLKRSYLLVLIFSLFIFSFGWLGRFIYEEAKDSSSYSKESTSGLFDMTSLVDNAKIGNFDITYLPLKEEEVQIKFDYIDDIKFKGNAESAHIKPLLLCIMRDERADYAQKSKTIDIVKPFVNDPEVQKALIYVIENDINPLIRMKSVTALAKVIKFKEVQKAMLNTLKNDESVAIRFKALEIIEKRIDEEILAALKNIKDGSKIITNKVESISSKYERKLQFNSDIS